MPTISLRDKADCLRVFIHADMKFRAERIVKEYGEREDSPEQRLRDKDKRRAAYHRFYTDMKWGHAQNYDVTLNSGTLGQEKAELRRLLRLAAQASLGQEEENREEQP